ncbi:polysaccharide lyase family 8 super-sandwich domain-containing protein [Streptosporangium sp. 'caverna']|uniref:polysaccharide lyase family 8 super-sandwich domain-containing protein n=1 Tax=Streptosporangium sp. 'caverna' TaxID=2202249 RepID=UPI000D7DE49E|nr:polysaccharide lyase family 8 super-sandwich domain-containing protein [Streptosporangium sp. 'caverna']AWS46096.1 silent information regulator protein Sir2 [Streptosporangium sp. 'caverna']
MHDLKAIRTRLRHELLDGVTDLAEATRLTNDLAADGTWPDIDYTDRDGMAFRPLEHVARALRLALSKEHQAAALSALDAWRHHGPRSDNWWFNQIGAPQLIGDALLLLAGDLGTRQRTRWGDWLAGCAGSIEMTGQNLVWAQGIVLRHGLLANDGELVSSAVARMSTVLRVTDGEGIQEDLSFHQHGAQLYSGGYGSSLVADLALWIYAVHDTPWAFGTSEVRLFTDFLLDGQQWAVHGGGFDFTTMGRNITRAGAHRATGELRPAIRRLLAAGAPRRDELAAFDARLAGTEAGRLPVGPVGCRYYPRSDYLVHRRPAWSVSVRMSSTRTAPTESMNGENLRGRHLGDGVAAIRVGDDPQDGYRAVIPLWDWARLPGVTAEWFRDPAALLPRPNNRHGGSADVGGWSDGRHGIAVMRLEGTDRIADGWKAWFCFDDLFVALGAGITAPSAVHPVITTIDQRLAEGPMTAGPDPRRPRYVHHGRIGYVPLAGHGSVSARLEPRTGRWSDITVTGSAAPLSAEVFSIGFDHGPRPEDASYACLILPCADRTTTAERSIAPGVTVVSNTPELQSVRCHRSGVTLTARHDADGIALTREP